MHDTVLATMNSIRSMYKWECCLIRMCGMLPKS